MGYYVNTVDEDKEVFLSREGTVAQPKLPENSNFALVCLVDNGLFTAAGVCYDQRELDAFNNPGDYRFKIWYFIKKEKIKPFVQGYERISWDGN